MGSTVSTLRTTKDVSNLEEKKNKPARIPLNVALVAIVKIQAKFRLILARKRIEIIRKQILEQRRLDEIERQARIIERDEQTVMITSTPSGITKSGQLNNKNRFIRKITLTSNKNINISTKEDNPAINLNPKLILSKYTSIDDSHIIIFPLFGFVIKSRNNVTGKKIFFNICHHETITTMTSTSIREIYDTTYVSHININTDQIQHTQRPFTATTSSIHDHNYSKNNSNSSSTNNYHSNELYIQIVDIILPTIEYQECLTYNREKKNFYIEKEIKNEISKQIIKYWNIKNNDTILIDKYSYPNLTNQYYSNIIPIKLNIFNNNIEYIESILQLSKDIENNIIDTHKPEVLLSSTGLKISSTSVEDKKEYFSLPFISEYKGWVDVVTTGKRMLINTSSSSSSSDSSMMYNNTTSATAANATTAMPSSCKKAAVCGLAVVESTRTPSNIDYAHPIMLTDRNLPASVVEVLLPSSVENSSRLLMPLFGSAYATQQAAMRDNTSSNSSVDVPETVEMTTTATTDANGSSDSSRLSTAHPPLTPTPTINTTAGRSPRPHMITTTAAVEVTSVAPTPTATTGTVDVRSTTADSTNTNVLSPSPQHDSTTTATTTAIATTTTTSTGNSNNSNATPTTTIINESELLKPVPSECNTTLPMYVVLCNGILYLYNRDPTRKHYFPFNPLRPPEQQQQQQCTSSKERNMHNLHKKLSVSIENSNKIQPLVSRSPASEQKNPSVSERKTSFIPLIEYGRIMLCEDFIFTSSSSNSSSDNTEHTPEHYYLTLKLNNNYDPTTTTTTSHISYIYSQFNSFFQKNNNSVTIKLRSYTEYNTLTTHINIHIKYNQKIKERIHDYMNNSTTNMMINNILLNKKLKKESKECVLLKYNKKIFYKLENCLLYLYTQKKEYEYTGKGLFRILSLFNKNVTYKNIMLPDNSSQNIVSIVNKNSSSSGDTSSSEDFDSYDLAFHRPYAMSETDSTELFQCIQKHILSAHLYMYAYSLPMLEANIYIKENVFQENNHVLSVRLKISDDSEEMDSDDENDTEIETALKSHTLLTIFHIYHPNIHSIIDQKVQYLLPPVSTIPVPIHTVGMRDTFTSVPEEVASDPLNPIYSTHNIMEQELLNEFLLLQNNNTKNYLYNCYIILIQKTLYIFQNMKYITHINIQYISEKIQHENVKKWEKLQIYSRKQGILAERMKNSVFYIDSSSDEEEVEGGGERVREYYDEYRSNNNSSRPIYYNLEEKGLYSHHITTNKDENERIHLRAPTQPEHLPQSEHRHPPQHRNRHSHPIKSIDAAAPVYTQSIHTPTGTTDTTTAANTTSSSRTRLLSESKAPEGFNITAWEIRLVSYDKRLYSIRFDSAEDYYYWRSLLYTTGSDVTATTTTMQHEQQQQECSSNYTIAGEGQDWLTEGPSDATNTKESETMKPESTNNYNTSTSSSNSTEENSLLLPSIHKTHTGEPGFNTEMTRKFARILHKEEKVLASGLVFKHDPSTVPTTTSTSPHPSTTSVEHKQRRILLLTTSPRLLFLDPIGNIVRGSLDLCTTAMVEVNIINTNEFEIRIGGIKNKFTTIEMPEKTSMYWANKIKQALQ